MATQADDPNGIIECITEKLNSGEYQKAVEVFERDGNKDINKQRTPHLLFLGRGGSGKSALGNVLINGTSKGAAGPNIGTTTYIKTKRLEKDGTKYIIHDTRGIGDSTTNVQKMEAELKAVYRDNKEDCIVIVCIRLNDRITDEGVRQCFEVCNSLDPNVWDNVIVAITHSEVPLEMRNEANESEMLEDLKTEWRAKVQETIKGLKVEREVPVCFTSHTEADRPMEQNWIQKLIKAIIERSGQSESCFRLLFRILLEKLDFVCSHESMGAPIHNTDDWHNETQSTADSGQKMSMTTELTAAKPFGGAITMAVIGVTLGGGAGIASALGTGLAGTGAALAAGAAGGGLTAGAIAGAAAFGAVTIATSGVGALIGAGLGIGVAIAVVMVWLWIKRRRAQTIQ